MNAIWKVGFVGAGKMGGAVARCLATSGHQVKVYDLSPEAARACAPSGATAAESSADAVRDAEVVFTSLPLPEHVLATYRTLAPELRADTVCIDVSTIDPIAAREVSDLLDSHGHPFVACPLGKSPAHAESGAIPVFVGGPQETVAFLHPLLEDFAESIHDLGSVEAATTFKLISNLVGMTNVAVLAEGYLLARRAGIDAETFAAALRETGATSFQSDMRLPWMMEGDHSPRFSVDLAAKDLRLAIEVATRWAIPTPVGALGLSQLVNASAHGYGDQDATAVAKVLDPEGKILGRLE